MPTRHVVLVDHQTSLFEQLVTFGPYQNSSEVLREGLQRFDRRKFEDEMRLVALRETARIGITDIEAGAFRTFDSAETLGRRLATLTSEVMGA